MDPDFQRYVLFAPTLWHLDRQFSRFREGGPFDRRDLTRIPHSEFVSGARSSRKRDRQLRLTKVPGLTEHAQSPTRAAKRRQLALECQAEVILHMDDEVVRAAINRKTHRKMLIIGIRMHLERKRTSIHLHAYNLRAKTERRRELDPAIPVARSHCLKRYAVGRLSILVVNFHSADVDVAHPE